MCVCGWCLELVFCVVDFGRKSPALSVELEFYLVCKKELPDHCVHVFGLVQNVFSVSVCHHVEWIGSLISFCV